ncbi:MAG: VTT domain-containing protein [Legionellaceae bacterium]|nr:VTT domain-containing protein [Legionellaceae bacterium]
MSMPDIYQLLFHGDNYLTQILMDYGNWFYLIMFIVLFCETGVILTPFLPGDSLLFMCGSLAARWPQALDISLLMPGFILVAILGNQFNYGLGRWVRSTTAWDRVQHWIKPRYWRQAEEWYDRFGGWALVVGRFIPIVRTFVPFFAGVVGFPAKKYMCLNILGAVLWVGAVVGAGYGFGQLPFVKEYFMPIVYGVILFSVGPILWKYVKKRDNA